MSVNHRIQRYLEGRKVKKLVARATNPPVYHIHLRKTAGTSLNMGMLDALIGGDSDDAYQEMANKPNHCLIRNNRVVVGWNKALIESGQYHFGFSHIPFHQLTLPANVLTFTCLRNPVDRIISHYKMLLYYKENEVNHPCMATEGHWLGDGFDHFLESIPKKDLMAQLYCFSENYNVQEAAEALRNVDCVLRVDSLAQDKTSLEKLLGYPVNIQNYKRYDQEVDITDESLDRLKRMIAQELEFYQIGSTLK